MLIEFYNQYVLAYYSNSAIHIISHMAKIVDSIQS